MLSQSIGAPAEAVVKKGEKVELGQLIAKHPEKGLGVSLHSPCSGKILEITDKFVLIRV
jgi:Na+-translocating ferredoxin:NAD+ oxidoreductase RnfC subunit